LLDEAKEALKYCIAEESKFSAQVMADRKQLKKLSEVKDHCPTCGAKLEGVNTDHLDTEREKLEVDIQVNVTNANAVLAQQKLLQERIRLNEAKLALWTKYEQDAAEYEKYHELYDRSMPLELVDGDLLETKISTLRTEVARQRKKYSEVQEHNAKVAQHNAGVDSLLQQLSEYEAELQTLKDNKQVLVLRANNLNILAKAFSTNGLLAYKIECMIKDLENLTNEYLQQMSDGRFQLRFEIGGSDKLNVIITDNGSDVEILALSSGERARVNTSCLLAIRKLLQSISSTRSNLLILDETTSNLDAEGNEKLVEVLRNETDLNTILVSHSFEHPLIERLYITKINNFSRIHL
jgi:DNA repair exonuclease SbcCD ATPase subunit